MFLLAVSVAVNWPRDTRVCEVRPILSERKPSMGNVIYDAVGKRIYFLL